MTFFAFEFLPSMFWQFGCINRFRRQFTCLGITLLTWFATSGTLQAGLAASDVVVVVNGSSLNSRTLANHYVALRGIPAANVVVLSDVPNSEVISVDEFRRKILSPLLAEIDRRQLSSHVQCISYSADFPTAIDISEDLKPLGELPIYYTNKASINALTYLHARVQAIDPAHYINLEVNFYARRELENYFTSPAGDSTRDAWTAIEALIAESKHSEAADALESLLKSHPEQFPLAYLAAAEAAQAGDAKRAIKLLESAIAGGWNAGGYLAQDKRFDSVRDESDFQVLEFLLDASTIDLQPSVAFDARTIWAPNGIRIQDQRKGFRYILSTVLGVTRGGGTTLSEAIKCVERAAAADSTHPQGGFYFCLTNDVRTTTRQPGFERAVAELRSMGFEAEIVRDQLPQDKPAVLGAQIGTASFRWASSKSTLVPGSIAENLTSLGGVMTSSGGQTKLSEFIREGAAGSSGAVTEPYSLQPKFPHPQLYVHYARGASLAEAFYMSVTGPYQLLIVGDPICQPFSNAPAPKLNQDMRYLNRNEALFVELDISGPQYLDWLDVDGPRALKTTPLAPTAVGILFDDRNPQSAAIKPKIEIKIKGQPPGYHEVRFRFVADDPTAQRSDAVVPIWIGEKDTVGLSFPQLDADAGRPFAISMRDEKTNIVVDASGLQDTAVERVTLWHDYEQIAVASGSDAEFSIRLDSLGMGPVRLQPKAELQSGAIVAGIPVVLDVIP